MAAIATNVRFGSEMAVQKDSGTASKNRTSRRLIDITRRSLLPSISGVTFLISVFKQRLHVVRREGTLVRNIKVVAYRSKIEIDAVSPSEQIHAIGVIDSARGRHRR